MTDRAQMPGTGIVATRRHPSPPPLAEVLRSLAGRLSRLGPDRRDPERFHAEKSALVAELRRLAAEAEA